MNRKVEKNSISYNFLVLLYISLLSLLIKNELLNECVYMHVLSQMFQSKCYSLLKLHVTGPVLAQCLIDS